MYPLPFDGTQYPDQNKVNNYCIVGNISPTPGIPCIVLYKNHYQYIITSKIEKQVPKKPLDRRGATVCKSSHQRIMSDHCRKACPFGEKDKSKAATSVDYSFTRR